MHSCGPLMDAVAEEEEHPLTYNKRTGRQCQRETHFANVFLQALSNWGEAKTRDLNE